MTSGVPHPLPILGRNLLVLPAHIVVQLAALLQLLELGNQLPKRELIVKRSLEV